jgi:hypothetical protein
MILIILGAAPLLILGLLWAFFGGDVYRSPSEAIFFALAIAGCIGLIALGVESLRLGG